MMGDGEEICIVDVGQNEWYTNGRDYGDEIVRIELDVDGKVTMATNRQQQLRVPRLVAVPAASSGPSAPNYRGLQRLRTALACPDRRYCRRLQAVPSPQHAL